MKMKPGDLVKRHKNITLCDNSTLLRAHEELDKINRQINFIWAFATNRNNKPPISHVSLPRHEPGLLVDSVCADFMLWIKQSRTEDPKNILSVSLVRVLWEGEIVVTLAKWIEPVERSHYFRRGEL